MENSNEVFDARVRRGTLVMTLIAAVFCLICSVLIVVTVQKLFSGIYRIALIVLAVSCVFRIATYAFINNSLTEDDSKAQRFKIAAAAALILNATFNLFSLIVFVAALLFDSFGVFAAFALYIVFEALALYKQVKLIYSFPEAAKKEVPRPGSSVLVFTALAFIALGVLVRLAAASAIVIARDGFFITTLIVICLYKIALIASLGIYVKK